jgi:WD40 repeat protein
MTIHLRNRRDSLRILRSSLLVAALAYGCGGGSDTPTTPGDRAIRVVAGAGQTDTINAALAQAVVVEVRNGSSRVATGVTVRFKGIVAQPLNLPSVFVSPISQQGFSDSASDVTDAQGRAKTLVHLGISIGTALLEVSVPELGLVDSVSFTIKPGAPSSLGVSPGDTSIAPGGSYQLRVALADMFRHPLSDITPSFSATGVTVSPTGQVTAPNAMTRGRIVVSVGELRYNVGVSVVPKLPMVVNRGNSVVLINADGTGATTLATSTNVAIALGPSSVAATPSVAYHEGGPCCDGSVWVVQPGIAPRLLLSGTTRPAGWARLSPDGLWVYFVRDMQSLWRAHLDGTGLDSLASFSWSSANAAPTISPDGGHVAIEDGNGVKIVDVTTRTSRTLSVTCPSPRYSPDGAFFACLGANAVFIVRIDGTGQRQVADLFNGDPDEISGVDWSPDGQWLLATTTYQGAVLVELSSGTVLPLTGLGSDLSQVREASFVR